MRFYPDFVRIFKVYVRFYEDFVKKLSRTKEVKIQEGYFAKMNDFPSLESVDKIKTIVDSGELKLRGGEAVSASLQGGLKAWDTTKTGAQVANVVIETGLGTKSIGDAIVE